MIHGTPRDANSLSPVPSAARPARTARHMLLSFMDRTRLPSRSMDSLLRLVTPSSDSEDTAILCQQSRFAIDPRWLAYQIAQLCDDNSLVIDDTTHDRIFPYLRLSRPGSYFHNPGSAGGWAPGAALGAKLAAA